MTRITIKEAAAITGMSEQTIRVGLQQGIFEFGAAFQRPNSTKYVYTIYPEKFKALYGEKRKG